MLYSDDIKEEKDPKFEQLTNVFDRVQKAIHQQHRTLDYLVKKVNKLIERKGRKQHRSRPAPSRDKEKESRQSAQ